MAKSPARSKYDELHDKYHQILTTKAGTRYERLTALVFKALDEQHVVIHDLKLVGADPDVKHQIDVTIESGGNKRRVLIECKDFDISGSKVGLDILRNFRSVIEDTGADEGIVITCNSFTEDAQKYARSKKIKLAIVRTFEDRDMDGRIERIILTTIVQRPENATANIFLTPEQEVLYRAALAAAGIGQGVHRDDPVFVVKGTERQHFNEFVTERMNRAIQMKNPQTISVKIPSDGWVLNIAQSTPIPFVGLHVSFGVDEERHVREIMSSRIAELIVSGLGGSDIIIFGDEIEKHLIDPDSGKVV